jgi:hypothetical protein
MEGLQPDPACKPQVEDLINKGISEIESQKIDEQKVQLHRIDQAQIDLCKTDALKLESLNINPLFELQKIERSQIELLDINEPEITPPKELQKINEIQILEKCPFEPDNSENSQNEMRKIEPPVELPKNDKHQTGLQKADGLESIDELQYKHQKVLEPQLEQEIKDQTQIQHEKMGDEQEADLSAEPQIQQLLNKPSEPQVETKELDETQFGNPLEEKAEESHNEKQKFENDLQKIDKSQSGPSIDPPIADPSDEPDCKLMSQTRREQLNEDYMVSNIYLLPSVRVILIITLLLVVLIISFTL